MERFPHLYKKCFVPLFNQCRISQSTQLGPASLLAHRPMTDSDTICNSPNPPLANIVNLTVLKMQLRGTSLHTLIRNVSFPSLTDVRSHNPPPWGPASLLARHSVTVSDIICKSPSLLLEDIVHFGSLRIAISLTVVKRV